MSSPERQASPLERVVADYAIEAANLRVVIAQQREQIEQGQQLIGEQQRLIGELRAELDGRRGEEGTDGDR